MAKLIEMLQHVTQASSGGMGFFGRSQGPMRTARPAAVFVAGGKGDLAALIAAAEAGADGVIVSGWSVRTGTLAGLAEALRPHEGIWGVELEGESVAEGLNAARDQGAAFAVLGQNLPAGALFEELDRFDRVLAVEPPRDDLALLSLRAVNLLPAQAVLVQMSFTPSGLSKLNIADFTRLQLFWESLRFPSLVTLRGAPDAAAVRLLIQLGADGLVLSATGATATTLSEQVKALAGELERTPARRERDSGALLTGMFGAQVTPAEQPGAPTRRRPGQPEPDHE
jgi:hypothetical protein